ncbi:MAG: hypothetical protein ACI8XX_000431 [Polaribacter sp.]
MENPKTPGLLAQELANQQGTPKKKSMQSFIGQSVLLLQRKL